VAKFSAISLREERQQIEPLPEEDEAGNDDENEDLAAYLGAIVANISVKGNE